MFTYYGDQKNKMKSIQFFHELEKLPGKTTHMNYRPFERFSFDKLGTDADQAIGSKKTYKRGQRLNE